MEYQLHIALLLLIVLVFVNGTPVEDEPKIISSQNEVIAYVNHTAKLSCLIQNRHRQHVTWSRVHLSNDTQKLLSLLFVNSHKYSPLTRYHLTHLIEKDNREAWNLEIRHVHPSDQGYYSCVLTGNQPLSKLFHLKVLEYTRNPALTLRSTSDMQRRTKEQSISSSSSSLVSLILLRLGLLSVISMLPLSADQMYF